jgi:hypothetical protein
VEGNHFVIEYIHMNNSHWTITKITMAYHHICNVKVSSALSILKVDLECGSVQTRINEVGQSHDTSETLRANNKYFA